MTGFMVILEIDPPYLVTLTCGVRLGGVTAGSLSVKYPKATLGLSTCLS